MLVEDTPNKDFGFVCPSDLFLFKWQTLTEKIIESDLKWVDYYLLSFFGGGVYNVFCYLEHFQNQYSDKTTKA